MKSATLHNQNPSQLPPAWRQAESAARKINADDTCDDRVSENIFDVEDEWAEVDIIVRAMNQDES